MIFVVLFYLVFLFRVRLSKRPSSEMEHNLAPFVRETYKNTSQGVNSF